MIAEIFIATLIAASITYVLTPFTIMVAKKLSLVDDPSKRPHPAHTHRGIIPRAGGLPIFLGIFLPVFSVLTGQKQLTGIFLGASLLLVIGLLDDLKDISPYLRFATNCIAVSLVVYFGVEMGYITNPFGGTLQFSSWQTVITFGSIHIPLTFSQVAAFLWILWTTNIIGWSGGVDGQLPGFVAIAAVVIGILSLRFALTDPTQTYVTILSFVTAGAFLGFLPWNVYPQKIMPGYSGKTLAGYFLGILSILAVTKLGTAILVLAVPMTDAVFILARRFILRKPLVAASGDHLHHHLLSLGWSRHKVAAFYWGITALAGIAALTLSSKQKVFTAVLIIVLISSLIIWLNLFRESSKQPKQS